MRVPALLILVTGCISPPATGLQPAPARDLRRGPVAATATPPTVLADVADHVLRVSCDFHFHNASSEAQELVAIGVEAFDAAGALVARDVFDSHGISPAMVMLPARTVPPRGDLGVFDPLDQFPDVELARLDYAFTFRSASGAESITDLRVPVRRHRPRHPLRVPLAGNVLVAHAHAFHEPHRRIDIGDPRLRSLGMRANSARYALDLTVVDARGRMFAGDGRRLEEWAGYHAEVRSPADASVAAVVDGIPDNRMTPTGVEFAADVMQAGTILGNHIALDLGGGEVIVFAHLAAGLSLHEGDRVRAGDIIGRIGFSGNLDFVHTHVQLYAANGADADAAILTSDGVPMYFGDFVRVRGIHTEPVRLDGLAAGDIVRAR